MGLHNKFPPYFYKPGNLFNTYLGHTVYLNRTAWGLVYLQDPKYLPPEEDPWIKKTDIWNG